MMYVPASIKNRSSVLSKYVLKQVKSALISIGYYNIVREILAGDVNIINLAAINVLLNCFASFMLCSILIPIYWCQTVKRFWIFILCYTFSTMSSIYFKFKRTYNLAFSIAKFCLEQIQQFEFPEPIQQSNLYSTIVTNYKWGEEKYTLVYDFFEENAYKKMQPICNKIMIEFHINVLYNRICALVKKLQMFESFLLGQEVFHIEYPHMNINILSGVKGGTAADFKKYIAQRLLESNNEDDISNRSVKKMKFGKLICKADKIFGEYAWFKADNFKLNDHVETFSTNRVRETIEKSKPDDSTRSDVFKSILEPIDCNKPLSFEEVHEFMNIIANEPADFSKPLWKFHLIENVNFPVPTHSACSILSNDLLGKSNEELYTKELKNMTLVVLKFHHAIADGASLVTLLLNYLLDDCGKEKKTVVPLYNPVQNFVLRMVVTCLALFRGSYVLWKFLFLHKNRKWEDTSKKHHKTTNMRTFEHPITISLQDVKYIKNNIGTALNSRKVEDLQLSEESGKNIQGNYTVNDVILAATAGAYDKYIEYFENMSKMRKSDPFVPKIDGSKRKKGTKKNEKKSSDKGVSQEHNYHQWKEKVNFLVPVNLRTTKAEVHRLQNKFACVILSLPTYKSNQTMERFVNIAATLRHSMRSLLLPVIELFERILYRLNPMLLLNLFNVTTKSISIILSNIAGPREIPTFAGKEVPFVYFYVPQPGSVPLSVSAISQYDNIIITFAYEKHWLLDAELFQKLFLEEIQNLYIFCLQNTLQLNHVGANNINKVYSKKSFDSYFDNKKNLVSFDVKHEYIAMCGNFASTMSATSSATSSISDSFKSDSKTATSQSIKDANALSDNDNICESMSRYTVERETKVEPASTTLSRSLSARKRIA